MAGLTVEPDGRLACGVCGRAYHHLAQHVRLAHGFTAHEYRAWAGLNRTTRLVSRQVRDRIREAALPLIARLRAEGKLKRWDEDPERWRVAKAAAVAALREGKRPEARARQRESITPELRAAMASRRRTLNLLGIGRASGAQIAAGLRRALGTAACERCGAAFQRRSSRHRFCDACGRAEARLRARESAARRRLRERYGEEAVPRRGRPPLASAPVPMPCGRCGTTIIRRSPSHRWCADCAREVAREKARESAARRRLRERYGEEAVPRRRDPLAGAVPREVVCPRCGTAFVAASHRERFCPPCRPERLREVKRAWKARHRRERSGGG